MEPFATQKTLPNPENPQGVPGVTKRTPIPKREIPLKGTKSMLCPDDEHLQELVNGRKIDEVLPSLTAKTFGVLAVVLALGVLAVFWVERSFSNNTWALVTLTCGLIHVLAILSQILSSGRNKPGGLAILVLYVGMFLNLIIDHLLA